MKKPANKLKKKRRAPVQEKPKRKAPNPKGKGGFSKGISGNPQGRPKDPPEIKAIREAVRNDLIEAVGWAAGLSTVEAKKVKAKELPLLKQGVLKAFRMFALTGLTEPVKYLLDHTVGKPKETLDIDTTGGNIQFVIGSDYIPVIPNGDTDNKS